MNLVQMRLALQITYRYMERRDPANEAAKLDNFFELIDLVAFQETMG